MNLTILISAGLGLLPALGETPIEFGRIAWGRQLEPALQASAKSGKPIWLQFQEVPG